MATERFHKAAKDGLIEILKEATRRDCNAKDESGMTPTLYAASNGNLEALRLLCGRGGDPDKSDYYGNTALHHAAAQGHKAIVTFLVNFGANIFAMDIDERTPQELAGINDRKDILRYLDSVNAKMEVHDKKKVKQLKEKAKKDAEKRIKEFNKRQAKMENYEKLQNKYEKSNGKQSLISTLKFRIKKSGSMSNLTAVGNTAPRNSFSALVGSGGTVSRNITSTVQRKALANKYKNNGNDDDFKVSIIEDGKRSVSSIKGFRRDSEVLFNSTLENPRRGRLDGVFNDNDTSDTSSNPGNLTRSVSQPDFMQELNNNNNETSSSIHEPSSIFVRPGIGSIAFRKSISNTFKLAGGDVVTEESSIGSVEQYDDYLSGNESSDEDKPNGPLEMFLTAWGLREYMHKFDEQKIDLDTLILLTENDLKTLNLPLGPYRKLVTAINERKAALENPGELTESML